ncbi:MAG: GtrA family protein [Lachnospiraceae bacterium]|nr:GtrA family protein [Lachnospiraceae bacterium]
MQNTELNEQGYKKNLEERFCDALARWPKLHALYVKYEEILVYLVVGVMTTIVAWAAKFAFNALVYDNTAYPTQFQNLILSTVNWVAGVIFGYFANRKYVFRSHGPMIPEATKFVGARVSTYVLDVVVMQVLGNFLGINLVVATLISAVLVTIANYVFSKIFVFTKKDAV